MGEVVSLAHCRAAASRPNAPRPVHVYGEVEGLQVAAIGEVQGGESLVHVALVAPHPVGERIVATFPGDAWGLDQVDALADVVLQVLDVVHASSRHGGAA